MRTQIRFLALYFLLWILGTTISIENGKRIRLNFLESLAVDNFMKTRLDKMIVIKIEIRQMERNQRKLKLGTWNESNRP